MATEAVGEIMLNDSIFVDDVYHNGPIIYVFNSTFIAINSIFHNNSVGTLIPAGCLSLHDGDSSFENCSFKNNYGELDDGGTIYIEQQEFRISMSVFDNNVISGFIGISMDEEIVLGDMIWSYNKAEL